MTTSQRTLDSDVPPLDDLTLAYTNVGTQRFKYDDKLTVCMRRRYESVK